MIKKILTAALLSALLPVSASAATTYITDYQTYGSCPQGGGSREEIVVSRFFCIRGLESMANTYAGNRATRLKSEYNTQDVTVTSLDCYESGLCVIQFRVKY